MRLTPGRSVTGAFLGRLLLPAVVATLLAWPAIGAEPFPVLKQVPEEVRDLHYREVLYFHYQQEYFSALTTLLARREHELVARDSVDADLLRIGIELSYGMHESAMAGFAALLERRVALQPRDQIWLSLARTWIRRDYPARAAHALEQISADASDEIRAEHAMIGALLDLERGNERAALAQLESITRPPVWSDYARYNRIMLMNRLGLDGVAEVVPADPGRRAIDDRESRNLRDHANAALGYFHLERHRLAEAGAAFGRVGADSLVSGQARLGAGQAAFDSGEFGRAIAAWSALAAEEAPEPAVREARLMTAYAYWRLGASAEAAERYRKAIDGLDRESAELDSMIAAVRDDAPFLDMIADVITADAWRDSVPPLYRSRYLRGLAASDEFHEAWSAWRQLRFLRERLETWAGDIAAFEAMLATRRQGYARRLPEARERLKEIDIGALEARSLAFTRRIDEIRRHNDAAALATTREQQLAAMIADIETRLARHAGDDRLDEQRERLRILGGVLQWNIESDFKARLWEAHKAVVKLGAALERVEEGRARLHRAQQEAPGRFIGFDARIADTQARIAALARRLAGVVEGHEMYIKGRVIAELRHQGRLAAGYGVRARYELASLLDETAVVNADGEWRPALQAWLDFNAVAGAGDDERKLHAMRRIADLRLMLADGLTADHPERDSELGAAIRTYEALLQTCAECSGNDRIHYQLARAHDSLGDAAHSLDVLTRLVEDYPGSPLYAEAQFRRGEALFVQRDYGAAEQAYGAVLAAGAAAAFEQQARYKHGWSLFKQTRYEEAIDDFIAVLDRHLSQEAEDGPVKPDMLPGAERALVLDTLRVISLGFSHLDGPGAVTAYFASRPPVPYEHLIFAGLSDLYLEKERYSDAALTLAAFVARNPYHAEAAASQIRIMEIHDQAGFGALALQARRDFLENFAVRGPYWERHDIAQAPAVAERLRQELLAMAERAHAHAQAVRSQAEYREAARWYREFLTSFPADERSPQLSFLLAELLFESGDYVEAIARYEESAYHHGPHEQAAEAGYAALLSYERHITALSDREQREVWQEQAVVSALLFADRFPAHAEAPAVLARAAEQLFKNGEVADAHAVALRVVQYGEASAPALRRSAWMLIGQVQFDRAIHDEAEYAYTQAVALLPPSDPARGPLVERLAAAIYQQGQHALDAGAPLDAARQFLRVAQVTPAATIVETAEYDAAVALLAGGDRAGATAVLERFRLGWPASRWQDDVTRRLYFAYLDGGQLARAAGESVRLEARSSEPEEARAAAWQSAELYMRAGQTGESLRRYQHYLARYPEPLDQAIEARRRIADAYLAQGNDERHRHWLNEIVSADARAGAARTDFSRESAAEAALGLAEPLRARFEAVKLVIPLDRSLKTKRAAMDLALKAYRNAADYGVADVTTAATYYTGEIFHELSRALLASQRPQGLSEEEFEQYDILLEEQAYPFEEEAIRLHEVNYRRIAHGVYDDWVKRSIEQLGALLPARYGKAEILVSVVETIH